MVHENWRTRARAWSGTTARRQNARRCSVISALLLICHGIAETQAAELGNITVHSWLGRQLKASVMLSGDDARQSEARCFKGTLVNLNNEPIASLKVNLQHSAKGSILLLFGGSAVDEPAAMVRVENTCGTGAMREYALLLDQVPETLQSNTPLTAGPMPEAGATDAGHNAVNSQAKVPDVKKLQESRQARSADRQGKQTARKEVLLPDIISPSTGMLRLAAMLWTTQRSTIRTGLAVADSSGEGAEKAVEKAKPEAGTSRITLKLDHTLGGNATAGTSKSAQAAPAAQASGANTPINRSGLVAGLLSLIAFFGASAWIVLRIREMKTASKPWMPIDAVLDSGGERAEGVAVKQS